MTSSTGGAGALTLTGLTGFPTYASAFGTGSRFVGYSVLEYTDATLATLARAESGLGDLNGSTLVLTRTKALATWDGTTYTTVSPAAATFGTTAANVRVLCAPLGSFSPGFSLPFFNVSPSDNLGSPSRHAVSPSGTFAMVANTEYYVPHLWDGSGEVVQGAINVTASATSSGVKAAVYELAATGLPGRKVFDVAAGTPFATTSTGNKTSTVSAWLPPGWYYAGLISTGAPTLKAMADWSASPAGGSAGATINRFVNASGSYATGLPATAPTGGSLTAVTTASPLLMLKPRT